MFYIYIYCAWLLVVFFQKHQRCWLVFVWCHLMLISSTTEHRVQMCHQVFFAKLVCLPVDLAELPITKCQTIYVGVAWNGNGCEGKAFSVFCSFQREPRYRCQSKVVCINNCPQKVKKKRPWEDVTQREVASWRVEVFNVKFGESTNILVL